MSIDPKISREALAGLVCSQLQAAGIDVVLSGGSYVSIYSADRYVTKDLDFVDISLKPNRQIGKVLANLGSSTSPKTAAILCTLMFSGLLSFRPPLTVGDEYVSETAVAVRETEKGALRMLSPSVCVKDRLANFYYFNDRQCFEQAVLVAKCQPIDLKAMEKWHRNEG